MSYLHITFNGAKVYGQINHFRQIFTHDIKNHFTNEVNLVKRCNVEFVSDRSDQRRGVHWSKKI